MQNWEVIGGDASTQDPRGRTDPQSSIGPQRRVAPPCDSDPLPSSTPKWDRLPGQYSALSKFVTEIKNEQRAQSREKAPQASAIKEKIL